MKKLLILGGANTQIPLIQKAKEMGHYIITCDIFEANAGHRLAHEFYKISITDKESVLTLAKSLSIDGIVCYESDAAASTVSYVAEQLGLPTHPYTSVETLINKDQFRKFQQQNNLKAPHSKGYSSLEQAMAEIHQYKLPIMIKPVDSSGSRGVSKMDSISQLPELVENALKYSKSKWFIMEEFIMKDGFHISGDGFSVDGTLVFRSFADTYFSKSPINPFVPIGSTWPITISDSLQNKIHEEIQKILSLLDMKTGAYDFDIQLDEDGNVHLIEIGPRNGGAWLPKVIKYATGVDLIEYTIRAALGENCSDLIMAETKGYWANYLIHCSHDGIFEAIEFEVDFESNNIVEFEMFVKSGDNVSALSGGDAVLGIMLLKFSSMGEMQEKMRNMANWVRIKVKAPNLMGSALPTRK